VGDHWSAINIFKILLKKSNCYKHKIIERLCIAYTCIGLVNKAEYYRTLCIEDSSCDENIKSRVLYSLALLYLRHHNKVQHNIDKAEQYLNLAYSIISKNKINASQFSKVFNRNGFALCLYKKGKINEAIELLKWGIRILNKEKNDKNKLHSSVLVYNLFLCFKALDKPMKAIIYLKKLIEDDPKMAEYRSELIYYLIQKSKVKVALVEINSAILNFPDYFIFYLQHGYILFKKKDFINAELLFSKAVMYNFANEDALYNLLLTKIKLKKQDWIVNQFKKNAFPHYIIENNPRINTIIQYALCSQ
jgi:tetratricopeptide (TPR) repeat protein